MAVLTRAGSSRMLLALLLAASAAGDSEPLFHLALSVGGGLAYAYAGARAELRFKSVGLFVGTTPFPDLATQWPLSEGSSVIVAGARYASRGNSGLVLSIHWTRARYQHHLDTGYTGSALDPAGHDTYTATIGWRWFFRPFFLEIGIGGGVAHDFDHHGNGYDSLPGPLSRSTYPYPDGALAVGIEFF